MVLQLLVGLWSTYWNVTSGKTVNGESIIKVKGILTQFQSEHLTVGAKADRYI
jgi:hypothetical protein